MDGIDDIMNRIDALNETTGLKAVRLFQGESAPNVISKNGNRYAVYTTLPSNTYVHA